jgi:hypothetical protein
VTFRSGPHQRRLPFVFLTSIPVRTAIQKNPNRFEIPCARSSHRDSFAVGRRQCFRVSAGIQKGSTSAAFPELTASDRGVAP